MTPLGYKSLRSNISISLSSHALGPFLFHALSQALRFADKGPLPVFKLTGEGKILFLHCQMVLGCSEAVPRPQSWSLILPKKNITCRPYLLTTIKCKREYLRRLQDVGQSIQLECGGSFPLLVSWTGWRLQPVEAWGWTHAASQMLSR